MPLSTIVTDSIADANVTSVKIASSSVTPEKLHTTTTSATTGKAIAMTIVFGG